MTRPKPKLLIDIKSHGSLDVFNVYENRVNLAPAAHVYIPSRFLRTGGIVFAIVLSFLVGSSAVAPNSGGGVLSAQTTSSSERASLEAELAELEGQIAEYENTITTYRQQGQSLEGEIGALEAKINKINLQIKAITLSLSKLSGEISSTTSRINTTEDKIGSNKEALSALVRQVNEDDRQGLIEILLENPRLSDFFGSVNDILVVQDNLKIAIQELTELKGDLIDQKELLAMERSDVESLKDLQLAQKNEVSSTIGEKDQLLKVTKGQESAYQALLAETEKSAAEIRSRIFELLGGGQMTFAQALEFAEFAEQATGVRAALILAVLDRESSLGYNVGQCQYNVNPYYPGQASNKTTMHPTRDIPTFLNITSELGLDPDTTLVSCPIPSDGAYGGAMGPAQFIPSTWAGYSGAVASITGSRPASPWRNADAFVATGLLLRDNGANSSETMAAAKYYCGGNWDRYVCTNVYARNVTDTADKFQKDIDLLNS